MRVPMLMLVTMIGFGCSTVPKDSIPMHIGIPSGFATQQIEFAILAALASDPPTEGLTPEVEITDREFDEWFGWQYQMAQSDGRWVLESRRPGVIMAGFQRGPHYLRIAIFHAADEIRFAFDDSREMRESESYIHGNAVRWIEELDIRIRRSLRYLAGR